jgi:hypothetical protein
MDPVSVSTPIDAPRAAVHDLLRDLANRPAFTDHFMSEFRLERMESSGVGAAARFQVVKPKVWMETVIDEEDPPFRISESGRGGTLNRVPSFTVWEIVDGPATGSCVVTVTFWTEPANIFDRARERPGTERRFRRHWATALSRLKHLIEDGGPVERVGVAGGDALDVA